ncbi:hypothetical protein LO80_04185 [Candidatus Francisella endociliophora]|uniref:Uncharacterized protein n=1 Tax=Candidatus Francisella endociliophora TaxID=653937 RepID=A0A097ENV7_9GAMM|nr:hypothetical protein [Francisella sp. FSC1006]AIT09245.1 hypothetical protein LO80_04185 [Francisella sp. FSC1006]
MKIFLYLKDKWKAVPSYITYFIKIINAPITIALLAFFGIKYISSQVEKDKIVSETLILQIDKLQSEFITSADQFLIITRNTVTNYENCMKSKEGINIVINGDVIPTNELCSKLEKSLNEYYKAMMKYNNIDINNLNMLIIKYQRLYEYLNEKKVFDNILKKHKPENNKINFNNPNKAYNQIVQLNYLNNNELNELYSSVTKIYYDKLK